MPTEVRRPRGTLVAVGLAGLGAVGAYAPAPLAFALWALLITLASASWPSLTVAAYAVMEPFQALLTRGLPRPIRYFDEVVLLGISAIVLLPIAWRRPYALLGDRFGRLFALFAAWTLASAVLNHVRPVIALSGLFVTVDYILAFLVLRSSPIGPRAARILCRVLIALGLGATLTGLLQRAFPGRFLLAWQLEIVENGVLRVPGPFEHPNDFGFFMLVVTLVAIARWHVARGGRRALVSALCALGLIMSVSRSGAAALVVGLAVGLIASGRRAIKIPLPAMVMVVALGGGLLVRGVSARIEKYRHEGGDARVTYVVKSIPILLDHPVFGVGPGRFGGEIAHRNSSPVYAAYGITFNDTWSTVDSFWLHALVEGGVVGAALLAWLLVTAAVRARRLAPATEDPYVRALLLAAPMLVAGFFVICLSSMALEANTTAGVFWLILGVAFGAAGDRVEA